MLLPTSILKSVVIPERKSDSQGLGFSSATCLVSPFLSVFQSATWTLFWWFCENNTYGPWLYHKRRGGWSCRSLSSKPALATQWNLVWTLGMTSTEDMMFAATVLANNSLMSLWTIGCWDSLDIRTSYTQVCTPGSAWRRVHILTSAVFKKPLWEGALTELERACGS